MKKTNKRNSRPLKDYFTILSVILIVMIGGFTLTSCTSKNNNNDTTKKNSVDNSNKASEKTYTIVSVGNMMTHDAQIAGAKQSDGTYNFDKSFEYVKPYIKDANLSIGIFEGNVTGGKPQGYPTFNSPEGFLKSLKNTGFDVINYASNHVIDEGLTGVKSTMEKSTKDGLLNLGVKEKPSDKNYLVYNIDGHKLGLFAYTYKTSENSINSIPIPSAVKPLVNAFSYDDLGTLYKNIETSIKEMKKEGVEFIVGSFHFGDEYSTKPNKYQKEIAEKMNDLGVDIVLGGHPHVIEPYEVLNNKHGFKTFVTYSQGNFLSNQCYERLHNYLPEDGLLFKFTLGLTNNKLKLNSYEVVPTWVYRRPKGKDLYTHTIIPVIPASKDPKKFDLNDAAYNGDLRSLHDTEKILGVTSFENTPIN